MKNLFVAAIALGALITGVYAIIGLFNISYIQHPNEDFFYNIGYFIGVGAVKIVKIAFCCFIMDQCVQWFKDEEIEKN